MRRFSAKGNHFIMLQFMKSKLFQTSIKSYCKNFDHLKNDCLNLGHCTYLDRLSVANCISSLACNTCSTQDDDATFCYPMRDRRNEKPVMDNTEKPLV